MVGAQGSCVYKIISAFWGIGGHLTDITAVLDGVFTVLFFMCLFVYFFSRNIKELFGISFDWLNETQ